MENNSLLKKKDQQHFPWMSNVWEKLSRNFLRDYDLEALQFLHFNITEEVNHLFEIKDRERSEALFNTLGQLYSHFCWKIKWNEVKLNSDCDSMKSSCVILLSDLTKVGLLLSGSKTESTWMNRISTAMKVFPGGDNLLYDALLLLNALKKEYQPAYAVLLKHMLCSSLIETEEPKVYFKVLLLFRRLRLLLKNNYEKTVAISLATGIKPPPESMHWLSTEGLEDLSKTSLRSLAKLLVTSHFSPDVYVKLREAVLAIRNINIANDKMKTKKKMEFYLPVDTISDDSRKRLKVSCIENNFSHAQESESSDIATSKSRKKKRKLPDSSVKENTIINDVSIITKKKKVLAESSDSSENDTSNEENLLKMQPSKSGENKNRVHSKIKNDRKFMSFENNVNSPTDLTVPKENKSSLKTEETALCSETSDLVNNLFARESEGVKQSNPSADSIVDFIQDASERTVIIEESQNDNFVIDTRSRDPNSDNSVRISELICEFAEAEEELYSDTSMISENVYKLKTDQHNTTSTKKPTSLLSPVKQKLKPKNTSTPISTLSVKSNDLENDLQISDKNSKNVINLNESHSPKEKIFFIDTEPNTMESTPMRSSKKRKKSKISRITEGNDGTAVLSTSGDVTKINDVDKETQNEKSRIDDPDKHKTLNGKSSTEESNEISESTICSPSEILVFETKDLTSAKDTSKTISSRSPKLSCSKETVEKCNEENLVGSFVEPQTEFENKSSNEILLKSVDASEKSELSLCSNLSENKDISKSKSIEIPCPEQSEEEDEDVCFRRKQMGVTEESESAECWSLSFSDSGETQSENESAYIITKVEVTPSKLGVQEEDPQTCLPEAGLEISVGDNEISKVPCYIQRSVDIQSGGSTSDINSKSHISSSSTFENGYDKQAIDSRLHELNQSHSSENNRTEVMLKSISPFEKETSDTESIDFKIDVENIDISDVKMNVAEAQINTVVVKLDIKDDQIDVSDDKLSDIDVETVDTHSFKDTLNETVVASKPQEELIEFNSEIQACVELQPNSSVGVKAPATSCKMIKNQIDDLSKENAKVSVEELTDELSSENKEYIENKIVGAQNMYESIVSDKIINIERMKLPSSLNLHSDYAKQHSEKQIGSPSRSHTNDSEAVDNTRELIEDKVQISLDSEKSTVKVEVLPDTEEIARQTEINATPSPAKQSKYDEAENAINETKECVLMITPKKRSTVTIYQINHLESNKICNTESHNSISESILVESEAGIKNTQPVAKSLSGMASNPSICEPLVNHNSTPTSDNKCAHKDIKLEVQSPESHNKLLSASGTALNNSMDEDDIKCSNPSVSVSQTESSLESSDSLLIPIPSTSSVEEDVIIDETVLQGSFSHDTSEVSSNKPLAKNQTVILTHNGLFGGNTEGYATFSDVTSNGTQCKSEPNSPSKESAKVQPDQFDLYRDIKMELTDAMSEATTDQADDVSTVSENSSFSDYEDGESPISQSVTDSEIIDSQDDKKYFASDSQISEDSPIKIRTDSINAKDTADVENSFLLKSENILLPSSQHCNESLPSSQEFVDSQHEEEDQRLKEQESPNKVDASKIIDDGHRLRRSTRQASQNKTSQDIDSSEDSGNFIASNSGNLQPTTNSDVIPCSQTDDILRSPEASNPTHTGGRHMRLRIKPCVALSPLPEILTEKVRNQSNGKNKVKTVEPSEDKKTDVDSSNNTQSIAEHPVTLRTSSRRKAATSSSKPTEKSAEIPCSLRRSSRRKRNESNSTLPFDLGTLNLGSPSSKKSKAESCSKKEETGSSSVNQEGRRIFTRAFATGKVLPSQHSAEGNQNDDDENYNLRSRKTILRPGKLNL